MVVKDLQGLKFNRLTAVRYLGKSLWECRCECGNTCRINAGNLQNDHTTSCGCRKIETIRKHGLIKTPEYNAWTNITNRCCNPNHPSFKYYGGRGIYICPEWRYSFQVFYNHLGKRPSA